MWKQQFSNSAHTRHQSQSTGGNKITTRPDGGALSVTQRQNVLTPRTCLGHLSSRGDRDGPPNTSASICSVSDREPSEKLWKRTSSSSLNSYLRRKHIHFKVRRRMQGGKDYTSKPVIQAPLLHWRPGWLTLLMRVLLPEAVCHCACRQGLCSRVSPDPPPPPQHPTLPLNSSCIDYFICWSSIAPPSQTQLYPAFFGRCRVYNNSSAPWRPVNNNKTFCRCLLVLLYVDLSS